MPKSFSPLVDSIPSGTCFLPPLSENTYMKFVHKQNRIPLTSSLIVAYLPQGFGRICHLHDCFPEALSHLRYPLGAKNCWAWSLSYHCQLLREAPMISSAPQCHLHVALHKKAISYKFQHNGHATHLDVADTNQHFVWLLLHWALLHWAFAGCVHGFQMLRILMTRMKRKESYFLLTSSSEFPWRESCDLMWHSIPITSMTTDQRNIQVVLLPMLIKIFTLAGYLLTYSLLESTTETWKICPIYYLLSCVTVSSLGNFHTLQRATWRNQVYDYVGIGLCNLSHGFQID